MTSYTLKTRTEALITVLTMLFDVIVLTGDKTVVHRYCPQPVVMSAESRVSKSNLFSLCNITAIGTAFSGSSCFHYLYLFISPHSTIRL